MTENPNPKVPSSRTGSRRRHRAAACALALILMFSVAGCGGSGHVHFAKTKFVLHAGLAFGAFHRYIYKPYESGGFTPVSSHKLAIVKAGAAGLFAYHEIKLALVDARSSPTLSKLVSPLTALETRLHGLGSSLHTGKLDPAAIRQAGSAVTQVGSTSSQSGATIHDLATPSLG
jgi:hypothetical protein